jgi:DNA-directed RNA polymerase II subunit RPB1
MTSFTYSPADIKKVERIQFGILNPDEISHMSVAEIVSPETMEKGKPKLGGLLDPNLGTVDRHIRCMTCQGNMTECPGHFGHIKLAVPMFHISFLNTVVKILQCVCYHCGLLLGDEVTEVHPIR